MESEFSSGRALRTYQAWRVDSQVIIECLWRAKNLKLQRLDCSPLFDVTVPCGFRSNAQTSTSIVLMRCIRDVALPLKTKSGLHNPSFNICTETFCEIFLRR